MIKRCISYFKVLFSNFLNRCVSLHKKTKKRSKKVTKVIEIEAFGCMPASSADCINIKGYQTIH
jgi:hypothetical protein